jgi:hypothetical protein
MRNGNEASHIRYDICELLRTINADSYIREL